MRTQHRTTYIFGLADAKAGLAASLTLRFHLAQSRRRSPHYSRASFRLRAQSAVDHHAHPLSTRVILALPHLAQSQRPNSFQKDRPG